MSRVQLGRGDLRKPKQTQFRRFQIAVEACFFWWKLRYTESNGMTIDERIEAVTMNLELAFRDIHELKELANKDGENIRALARIAEAHPQRIEHLEGGRG